MKKSLPASYNPAEIEVKWTERWKKGNVYVTPQANKNDATCYILDMFPYPSGSGIHVGHIFGYVGSDVIARFARLQGKKVMHPMGWDSFGLPAENFAIKTGVHPAISTEKSIATFKKQIAKVALSYDWEREISTSSPEYYRWTQWFFCFLYEKGLAYRKEGLVNWCESCQTVLANEQVIGGHCERCDSKVVQRKLKQWYFKITDYAERLLADLDTIDWPEKIKLMQRNWIGKSEGANVWFEIEGSEQKLQVFTTRPDTIFGVSYVVLAPEHELLSSIVAQDHADKVADYQKKASAKSELERLHLDKKKTGVPTGAYAINPANGARLPIWVADYVVSTYGTGAVMGVPGHDERDAEFAAAFDLPTIQVITDDGEFINSGHFTGRGVDGALDDLLQHIGAEKTITYRLRDWLVSRQRFWGAPIPIAYDSKGKEHLIPDSELPVVLPMNVEFKPTGESPLVHAKQWREYKNPSTGEMWQREVDTLDTFVCSSWYFLRFCNPEYRGAAFDPDAVATWMPVDTYIGGAEHAVLHLLYARFFTKVLFDAGLVPFNEPFKKLVNQGMILGPDHQKMSKSKGNVISPDDIITDYGADTLRAYELFMGPFEQEKPWSTSGIVGVRRFLDKTWRLYAKADDAKACEEELRILHTAIAAVTRHLESHQFNTAVSSLMEATNAFGTLTRINRATLRTYAQLFSPIMPFIAEELWEATGGEGFACQAAWPAYKADYLTVDEVTYVIQVNGKVRAKVTLPSSLEKKSEIEAAVTADQSVQKALEGKSISKTIVVPGKLVSFVVSV